MAARPARCGPVGDRSGGITELAARPCGRRAACMERGRAGPRQRGQSVWADRNHHPRCMVPAEPPGRTWPRHKDASLPCLYARPRRLYHGRGPLQRRCRRGKKPGSPHRRSHRGAHRLPRPSVPDGGSFPCPIPMARRAPASRTAAAIFACDAPMAWSSTWATGRPADPAARLPYRAGRYRGGAAAVVRRSTRCRRRAAWTGAGSAPGRVCRWARRRRRRCARRCKRAMPLPHIVPGAFITLQFLADDGETPSSINAALPDPCHGRARLACRFRRGIPPRRPCCRYGNRCSAATIIGIQDNFFEAPAATRCYRCCTEAGN